MGKKYDKHQHYLIQDEGHPGQDVEDRIFIATPMLVSRKDMRPYDPIKGEYVQKITPKVVQKETVELQGKSFSVSPDLRQTIAEMAEYVEKVKAENEKEQAGSVPDSGDQNDTPNGDTVKSPKQPRARKGRKKTDEPKKE
jgi:antitoxin component of MazEF toxin-antitoxin module